MKYIIVYLCLTILLLYAALDYQHDKINGLQTEITISKAEIITRTAIINVLEDYRQTLKPPAIVPYGWPVELSEYQSITSYYGERNDPLRQNIGGSEIKYHPAVDMKGIKGARVQAVASGVVLDKWYDAGWHNGRKYHGHNIFNGYITILHDDGMISHYGHVSDILVHEDQRITAGQSIARISRIVDKHSTGPHIHFALQDIEGNYVNPLLWIGK